MFSAYIITYFLLQGIKMQKMTEMPQEQTKIEGTFKYGLEPAKSFYIHLT